MPCPFSGCSANSRCIVVPFRITSGALCSPGRRLAKSSTPSASFSYVSVERQDPESASNAPGGSAITGMSRRKWPLGWCWHCWEIAKAPKSQRRRSRMFQASHRQSGATVRACAATHNKARKLPSISHKRPKLARRYRPCQDE